MDFNLEQLTALGVDLKTGMDYTGNREKYMSALQRFYKSSESNKEKIDQCLEAGDMENLSITVHALKSNARMLGAETLAQGFETLEMASRNGDAETVNAEMKPVMQRYEGLLLAIKPLGEMESITAAGEISAAEAKDVAEKLLAALYDFDDELSADLVKKLSGYPFRITQRGKLREAADLISDFMYDEAADLIKEVVSSIE